MDQTQLLVLASGLGLLLLFCLFAVLRALGRRRAFERELAAVRAGQYAPAVAYQRYARPNAAGRITIGSRFVLIIVVLLCAVVGYFLYNDLVYGNDMQAFLFLADAQDVIWFLVGPILLIPVSLYSLLAVAWADAPAMAQLRNLPTQPRDLVILRLKNFTVIVAPLLILLELAALAIALGSNGVVVLLLLLFALLVAIIASSFFSAALTRWYYPSTPIAQTQWAALEPRVHAWARLAGVPLGAVYVRQVEKFGIADSSVTFRRPHAAFFSDTFLANSDWRQQDAMACLLLAFLQARQQNSSRARTMRGSRLLALLGLTIVIILVFVAQDLITYVFPAIDLTTVNLLVIGVLIVVFLVFIRIGLRSSRRSVGGLREQLLARDRDAVALCGDPLALMAVLLTVTMLQGNDINRRITTTTLSTRDRITTLQQALTQPGPFAPWAFQPIPCLIPLQMGPYALSTPLTPEAKAMPPTGPVPWARWQISNSPWAALPMMENASSAPGMADMPGIPDVSYMPNTPNAPNMTNTRY